MAYVVLTRSGLRLAGEVRETLERKSAECYRDQWSKNDIATLAWR